MTTIWSTSAYLLRSPNAFAAFIISLLNMSTPPSTLLVLPPGARCLEDADEEVFLLYTRLASLKPSDTSDATFRGLGFLNAQEDDIEVRIDLIPPTSASEPSIDGKTKGRNAPRKASKKGKSGRRDEAAALEFQLFQDKTALRSRSGDTGSVLWRAR